MKKLLLTIFATAMVSASALAETVTCEVKPSTGTLSGTTWTSNSSTPSVKMALSGGAISTLEDNEKYQIQTQSAARTLTFTPTDYSYYVSSVSIDVNGFIYNEVPDVTTLQSGTTSLTANAEVQNFSVNYAAGQLAMVTITPIVNENKRVEIGNIVVTLSQFEGTATRTIEANLTTGEYNNGTGWSSVWTSHSNIDPQITITANAANMGRSNGIFDFRSGSAAARTGTYTIAANSIFWYVSGFSFDAKMGGDNTEERKIQISGQEEVVLTSENQHFSAEVAKGSDAVFQVKGANQAVLVSNLTVTLTHISTAEAMVTYNAIIDIIDLWHPILGDELYNEKKALLNDIKNAVTNNSEVVFTAIPEVEAINASWLAEANGRLIYLKNIRRPQANGKYLTANAGNNEVNTKGAPVANSNWMVEVQGTTPTFKLFNPEKNKYLGKAAHNAGVSVCGADDAGIFELNDVTNQGGNNGTAFHITNISDPNGELALNVNEGTSHLVTWYVADGGSTWTIELAGVPASEIAAGKYYRIRSARTLAKTDKRAEGSLLGVNTAVENGQAAGNVAIDPSRFSGLGTIWRIDNSDVEGKYYIRNAATEFEGQADLNLMGKGAANANVSDNAGKFVFLTKDSNWNHKHPKAVIIKNQDNNYADTNSGGNSMGTWTQCDNQWPNNGGIYFFEEATDYEDIKNAYIAAANGQLALTELQNLIDNNHILTELWSENDIAKAQKALDKFQEAPSTTVAKANSRHGNQTALKAQMYADFGDELCRAAENKPFIAWNIERHSDDGFNYYLSFVETSSFGTDDEKSNVVGTTLDKTSLAAHWTLEYQGNGKYFIKNYLNNRLAGFNDSDNHPFQTSETEGNLYEVLGYTINGKAVAGFKTNGWFMHQTNNGTKDYIVRWTAPNDDTASGWYVSYADHDDNAVELLAESDATRIIFRVAGGTLTKHDAYGDHHAVIVTKQPAAEEQQLSRAIIEEPTSFLLSSDEHVKALEDGTFAVDYNGIDNPGLEEGTYIVTVPTAAFKTSDGKVTRTGSFTVTVDAAGNVNTTGIENVVAKDSKPAHEVIYDLQGRRVNKAARGLYIINGKKVFVK